MKNSKSGAITKKSKQKVVDSKKTNFSASKKLVDKILELRRKCKTWI